MSDTLPIGDMGSKNLPVPVTSSLPVGIGDREISASPKVKDGLEPIILSLDLLNESMDSISSVVSNSDMNKITISELDKLFQKYFSKQSLSDSVSLAFTRQSPPAIDSSLMVRQQVKANEVIKKQPSGKFEDVFSKQSPSSKSSQNKTGASFEEGYNKVLDTAYQATHNPMKLVDKLIPSIVGLFKKKGSGESEKRVKESRKSEKKVRESFYGQGEVEDGSFFGSFGNQPSNIKEGSFADINNMGLRGLGHVRSPTSSVKDVQEEAAEVGIKADKSLFNTLENPEQSSFAQFVSGDTKKGNRRGKEETSGFASVLIAGMILTALIVFRDVVKKVFDKVLIPLGELLVDFLTLIKQPFVRFLTAFLDVAVVVLGVIKDVIVEIKPFLIKMAQAVCEIVITVLGTIQKVIAAIEPYIVRVAQTICGIVATVLGIVQRVLEAIEPHIISIAVFLAETVAEWLNENKENIGLLLSNVTGIATAISGVIKRVLEGIESFLSGLNTHMMDIGNLLGGILVEVLSGVKNFLEGLTPHMQRIGDVLGGVLTEALRAVESILRIINVPLGAFASALEGFTSWVRNSVVGKFFGWDDDSKAAKADAAREAALNAEAARIRGDSNTLGVLTSALGLNSGLSREEIPLLQGIYRNTEVIASLLFEVYRDEATSLIRSKSVGDLIISSDGQVFETAPSDSVLAIQNGAVSMQSSSPVSGISNRPNFDSGSSQGSQGSNVTNIYSSSSNIDFSGVSPFSEFCPVGV